MFYVLQNEVDMSSSYKTAVKLTFDDALNAAIDALKAEGFDVVSQIDLHARFKAELGANFSLYTILGVYNASLAYRIIQADRMAGIIFPINVAVIARDEHYSEVAVILPDAVWSSVLNAESKDLLQESSEKLRLVIDNLASAY